MCIECEILVSGSECLNMHTSFPVVYLSTACWSVVYFYWRHVSTKNLYPVTSRSGLFPAVFRLQDHVLQ